MPIDKGLVNANQGAFSQEPTILELERRLLFLSAKEIGMIDDFLAEMEEEGELRLIVYKGRLRFVTETKDFEVPESKNRI